VDGVIGPGRSEGGDRFQSRPSSGADRLLERARSPYASPIEELSFSLVHNVTIAQSQKTCPSSWGLRALLYRRGRMTTGSRSSGSDTSPPADQGPFPSSPRSACRSRCGPRTTGLVLYRAGLAPRALLARAGTRPALSSWSRIRDRARWSRLITVPTATSSQQRRRSAASRSSLVRAPTRRVRTVVGIRRQYVPNRLWLFHGNRPERAGR
jgi:hypothetical protein